MVWLNRVSIVCMALSIAVMLQPFWTEGFRVGFFALIVTTAAQIVASHLPSLATRH
jgi:hypothetical protein